VYFVSSSDVSAIFCNESLQFSVYICSYFTTFNLVNGATPDQRLEFDRKAQGWDVCTILLQ